jgi:hypothetical protein
MQVLKLLVFFSEADFAFRCTIWTTDSRNFETFSLHIRLQDMQVF